MTKFSEFRNTEIPKKEIEDNLSSNKPTESIEELIDK